METPASTYLDIYNKLDFDKIIDHPNILIAANFWEEERFMAAKTCYKFMREIDDLIDDYKSEHKEIREEERDLFVSRVSSWIDSLKNGKDETVLHKDLAWTFNTYKIPFWTMETFAESMIYDIYHKGFSSLDKFLDYSRGACIAPASVFVHLCGIRKEGNLFSAPSYDVRRAATPCAVFSYLVHIIRDFQKDQLNNLNYFADDKLQKYGLAYDELHRMASGEKISNGFRALIKEYMHIADQYRMKTFEMIKEISPLLEPRYQLSLDIIFNLYLMVYERINVEEGNFTTAELNPTAQEIKERVYKAICNFKEVGQKQFVVS